MKKQWTILVFMESWSFARRRLLGIRQYAEKKNWRIHVFEREDPTVSFSGAKAVRLWHSDGCIIDGDLVSIPNWLHVPTVYCDADARHMPKRYFGIEHDSRTSVRLAMKELLSLGSIHYAYVGSVVPREWSLKRQLEFVSVCLSQGVKHSCFPNGTGDFISWYRRLSDWISALPRPCGILAANDHAAISVLDICNALGILVPESIAVIGIDNNESLCENTEPTLSSVMPDFKESGYRAAEMLDRLMNGDPVEPPVQSFPTVSLVRRQSTQRFGPGAGRIAHVVEYIRTHAGEAISVDDVVQEMGQKRRTAESRFRRVTGRSIYETIQDARLQKAQALLLNRSVPIKLIHAECGYADDNAFRRFFTSRMGVPPGAWREKRLRDRRD